MSWESLLYPFQELFDALHKLHAVVDVPQQFVEVHPIVIGDAEVDAHQLRRRSPNITRLAVVGRGRKESPFPDGCLGCLGCLSGRKAAGTTIWKHR